MRKAPGLIRIFSYIFMFMGVVAFGALLVGYLEPGRRSGLSVTFLTVSFSFSDSPILYTATSLFFIFAGLLGLNIILKKPYAYGLGVIYCIIGLVFFGFLTLSGNGLIHSKIASILIHLLIFGSFMVYLIRHRAEWKRG